MAAQHAASGPAGSPKPSPTSGAVPPLCVTIDRPERRNAVDGPTAELLAEASERFEADDDARVLVLTGAGGVAFCAGADLKAIESLGPRLDLPERPARLHAPDRVQADDRRDLAAGAWPAGWSWRSGATCGSPRRTRRSASPSAAGACR